MFKKPAHKDLDNPPGQIINKLSPVPDNFTPYSRILDRSRLVTWEKPIESETPEDAYRRGWTDALDKYENEQRMWKNKLIMLIRNDKTLPEYPRFQLINTIETLK